MLMFWWGCGMGLEVDVLRCESENRVKVGFVVLW